MATIDAKPDEPPPAHQPLGLSPFSGALDLIEEAGELTAFAGRSVRAMPGAVQYISETMRQTADMIKGTTFLTFLLNLFFGAEIVNFLYFFIRAIGAGDELGIVGYAAPAAAGDDDVLLHLQREGRLRNDLGDRHDADQPGDRRVRVDRG